MVCVQVARCYSGAINVYDCFYTIELTVFITRYY